MWKIWMVVIIITRKENLQWRTNQRNVINNKQHKRRSKQNSSLRFNITKRRLKRIQKNNK